jgi:hypothetical protein
MGRQIPTWRTTTAAIMASPEFELGLDDARNGVPFDWRINEWDYERGRLFAFIAPRDMPLHTGWRLNPKAVALYKAARARNLIL